jgi:hypothetical protein
MGRFERRLKRNTGEYPSLEHCLLRLTEIINNILGPRNIRKLIAMEYGKTPEEEAGEGMGAEKPPRPPALLPQII